MSSAGRITKNQSNVVAFKPTSASASTTTSGARASAPVRDVFKVAKGNADYENLVNKPAKVSSLVPVDEAHATLEADMNAMALSEVFGDLGSEFKMDAKDLEFLQQLDEKGLLA